MSSQKKAVRPKPEQPLSETLIEKVKEATPQQCIDDLVRMVPLKGLNPRQLALLKLKGASA